MLEGALTHACCLQLWLIQQQPINCIIIKGPQQKEAMSWCIELMIDEHCNPSLMSAQMVHHERISYSQQMCWWIKLMTDEHCHPESWTEQGLAPSSSLGGMSTAEPPISYPQQWWRWWWAMSFHNRFWTLADLAISRNDCGTTWLSSSPNSLWNKSQANRLGCWLLLMKKGCMVFS